MLNFTNNTDATWPEANKGLRIMRCAMPFSPPTKCGRASRPRD